MGRVAKLCVAGVPEDGEKERPKPAEGFRPAAHRHAMLRARMEPN